MSTLRHFQSQRFSSSAALRAKIGTLSLDKQKKLEEDVAKAEKKAEKKADAALKKQQVGLLISII